MLIAVSRAAASKTVSFLGVARPVLRGTGSVLRINGGSFQARAMSEEKAAKEAAASGYVRPHLVDVGSPA